jgi:hypothetical protein
MLGSPHLQALLDMSIHDVSLHSVRLPEPGFVAFVAFAVGRSSVVPRSFAPILVSEACASLGDLEYSAWF